MSRAALVPMFLVLLAGCGGEERASAPAPAPTVPAPSTEPVRDPPAEPPAGDPLRGELGATPADHEAEDAIAVPLGDRHPPARGCALQSEQPVRVLAGGGAPAIVAHRSGFLIAAHVGSAVSIVRLRPGSAPAPFATVTLEQAPRGATPALALTGENEVTLAMVDGRGRVLIATLDPSVPAVAPIAREVAESGADARFAPAVRSVGTRRAIAWTDGSATPMRLRLAVLGPGDAIARHDVTPIAGGGAAPTFVEGTSEAVLVFLDPRVAISVAHRVAISSDGTPAATEVARPLNLASEPPAIAAVRTPARTWLAYAAVGNLATRAIGLVDASGTERPLPLIAGLGYGDPIALDVIAVGERAIFALEAPSAASAEAPHELRLRVVDGAGIGPETTIAAPAIDPALAMGEGGVVAIALRAGPDVVVHFARCDG